MRKFATNGSSVPYEPRAGHKAGSTETTVAAGDMRVGCVYKHTRNSGGVYYVRPPVGTAMRLAEKYKRAAVMKLTVSELAMYRAALAEIRGELVLARRFIRGKVEGERYEVQDIVGLPVDYRLRCVSSKPGYDGLVL